MRAAVRSLVVPLSCFALLLSAGAAVAVDTTGSPGTPAPGVLSGATTTQATSVTTTSAQITTASALASPSASSSSVLGSLRLIRADKGASGFAPSTPAIALAALAAALVLLSLAWALVRAFVYEPAWMPALRHSFAEAGFRASATWAELWDWLRLGR